MPRKSLLACGVLASLLYVGIDVLAAIRYGGYHSFSSRAISELMARGAPTEQLVDPLFLLYDLLMIAFAAGVWLSSPRSRARLTAALLFGYAAFGLLGPTVFDMDVRGEELSTRDILHIGATGVLVLFILASVVAGSALAGRRFRIYSYATVLVMIVFGVLTWLSLRGVAPGDPTPGLGIAERINIGAFLLWVVVLALSLWPATEPAARAAPRGPPARALTSR